MKLRYIFLYVFISSLSFCTTANATGESYSYKYEGGNETITASGGSYLVETNFTPVDNNQWEKNPSGFWVPKTGIEVGHRHYKGYIALNKTPDPLNPTVIPKCAGWISLFVSSSSNSGEIQAMLGKDGTKMSPGAMTLDCKTSEVNTAISGYDKNITVPNFADHLIGGEVKILVKTGSKNLSSEGYKITLYKKDPSTGTKTKVEEKIATSNITEFIVSTGGTGTYLACFTIKDGEIFNSDKVGQELCSGEKVLDITAINNIEIPIPDDALPDPVETTTTTCAVEGVGWIICPVVRFLSKIADYAYGFIADNFLVVEKSLLANDSETKTAWNKVLSIANIVFVAAFLVIILSQLTSFGITNYGIKKMLPKLVIAIILVNLSFYICQIAVDISNIFGRSINSFITTNMSPTINASANASNATTGEGFAGIAGTVLVGTAAGVALWASLTALIPVVISAIVAAIMILFILAARKALIVILVVISPLAFVAYLLPNTEGLFKKWKKAFMSLLMVYPIIAFVFAGSKLASGILNANQMKSRVTNGEATDAYNIGQIIAAGISILPLFIVPGLLKKSLDGIGGIGAKINGIGDKLGKGAAGKYSNSKFNKNWEQGRATKKAMIEGGQFQGSKFNPNTWRSKAHGAFNKSGFSRRYGNVVAATGASTAAKQNKEDVDMASSQLENLNLDQASVRDIAKGKGRGKGNIAMQQAAIKQMVATNDVKGMNELWDDLDAVKADPKTDTREAKLVRNTFAESLLSSSGRPAWFGAGAIAGMRTRSQTETKDADGNTVKTYDQKNSRDTMMTAISSGAYSPDKLARADADEVKQINNLVAEAEAEQQSATEEHRQANHPLLKKNDYNGLTHIQQLKNNAAEALGKETTNALISKNREGITELSKGGSTKQEIVEAKARAEADAAAKAEAEAKAKAEAETEDMDMTPRG